jgi:hypothetical protein
MRLIQEHTGWNWHTDDPAKLHIRTHLADILSSEALWNVCHDLCQMYHSARNVERRELHRQFLEGRLRKRRRNHNLYVKVLPAVH